MYMIAFDLEQSFESVTYDFIFIDNFLLAILYAYVRYIRIMHLERFVIAK